MKDWNGRNIEFAKSKRGVIVVANPFDNLISKNCVPGKDKGTFRLSYFNKWRR
jgi:hypothetical protein